MILHMLVQTMRFLKLMPILAASAMIMMAASCSSGKTDYESAFLEWTGREIVFPDSMRLAGGGVFVKEPSDFTIVAYYDSEGCTGCRMKLPFWMDFMDKLDSVAPETDKNLILIVEKDAEERLQDLIRKSGFKYEVLIDDGSRFYKGNALPEEPVLQTFLLDSSGKVLAIGNPMLVTSLEQVYLDLVSGRDDIASSFEEETEWDHDFGEVESGQKAYHVFSSVNETGDTLYVKDILTSCECTEAEISHEVIPPGEGYTVKTSFQDTVSGDFHRTVKINFKKQKPTVVIGLSGKIITQLKNQ